ncbi:MAG: chromosome segregation protein SMC [Shimia sp.]|nr:chromosome segregation protein SMC [Shimia sp.]
MRFTRLRLNGFKSFVDPTDLLISDGLTGVVGPNGCGKSNLLEALRWVMGENRPTAMRGGGMEDVIFAGASSRNARNYAEVTLTIDNSERLAPTAFNDVDQLEIVRRITRDVGSAYKAAGKDVRARDVQMLFADASTGAHSPALVRQGQISELINARPKARRRILEEAAGISGLYQRRHEAELKLNAAEANLSRVDDVIENLTTQLAQLARQARQAARYREIGANIRQAEGLLLYRRWREADEAAANARDLLRTRMTEASEADRGARAAEAARQKAEDLLPGLREEDAIAAAVVQRLLVQRDTLSDQADRARELIETLTARIEQIDKDAARESALNRDAGETIETLTWEQTELEKAGTGHAENLAEAEVAARNAADVLGEREAALTELTEDVARLAARHQSAERLVSDHKRSAERAEAEQATAADARSEAEAKRKDAELAMAGARTSEAEARVAAEQAEADLIKADATRSDAQTAEIEARAARSEADGEVSALSAEVTAISRLLDRDTDAKGQILDKISVEAGLEAALGAALSDDLKYPEADSGSGWATLGGYSDVAALPADAIPLATSVDAPAALDRRLSQTGLVADAETGIALQPKLRPGQRLVTQAGDLWRWDGFAMTAKDAPSAAAARLQQINRLSALRNDLAALEERAVETRDVHQRAQEKLTQATEADKAARHARRAADTALADASRTLSRAEADFNLAGGKLESLAQAMARYADVATEARTALREAEVTLASLADLAQARATLEEVRITVEAARMTMMARRAEQDDLRRTGEAREKRRQEVVKEISGWRHRLETASARGAELAERRSETEVSLKEASAAPDEISAKRDALQSEISKAEARKASAADTLSSAEGALRQAAQNARDAATKAGEAREARAAAEARADAASDSVVVAAERIGETLNTTPQELLEALEADPEKLPAADAIEIELARLRRQRDALGAVNLRAEEDAKEVQVEHDTLSTEKTDLEEAIKKLRGGISALNREGRERLLTAFEEVNRNFSTLFTHLFGGGEAKLVLVESDDPLEAGLEIMCQPPGKKLSTLSLLSGGEQTLTALALIFAVFLANPAPICVLDEVDAPLDDANVARFCDLLDEMTRRTETRFLIITHHAVTMSRMDRLFGVTMGEQGVSQLVSVDLKKAETLVA